jgi:hypothetical protein
MNNSSGCVNAIGTRRLMRKRYENTRRKQKKPNPEHIVCSAFNGGYIHSDFE